MATGTVTAPAPTCGDTTDNGRGIVWICTLPPHPDTPNQHFKKAAPSNVDLCVDLIEGRACSHG